MLHSRSAHQIQHTVQRIASSPSAFVLEFTVNSPKSRHRWKGSIARAVTHLGGKIPFLHIFSWSNRLSHSRQILHTVYLACNTEYGCILIRKSSDHISLSKAFLHVSFAAGLVRSPHQLELRAGYQLKLRTQHTAFHRLVKRKTSAERLKCSKAEVKTAQEYKCLLPAAEHEPIGYEQHC